MAGGRFMPGLDGPFHVTIEDQIALAGAPRRPAPQRQPPEKQWWNIPAKKAAGERIAQEELDRARALAGPSRPHNNSFDATRHARWSRRMANEIDPIFGIAAGLQHEGKNIADSIAENIERRIYPSRFHPGTARPSVRQTLQESAMDLHNNLEGVGSALAGRQIDPSRLQQAPGQVREYGRAPIRQR
jgi:hypothetical protein